MEKEYMEFRYNEETGLWEKKKEPYTTIELEFETKEDYEAFMEILPRVQEEYKRKKLRKSAEGGFQRCKMNKQIEEMAKIMEECCNVYDEKGNHIRNKCNSYDCEYYCDTNYVCCSFGMKEATALYNAGYRKVDDIVEKVTVERPVMCDLLNEEQRELQKVLETRKETAREILQDIDNYHKPIKEALVNDGLYNTGRGVEIICSKIKKLIAEKYGVEV